MKRHLSLPLPALLACMLSTATASLTYCSSVCTGASSTANFSIYQSNGNCEAHCSDMAFGILLDKTCWCSNIAPNKATNVKTSECDDNCPGYPDDPCGNESKGLYAYIQLGLPSGTATVSSSSTSSTTSTTSTSSTSDSSTTESSTTTEASTETDSSGVTTITVGASVATSVADSSDAKSKDSGGSSVSGGAIAGIVVGVVGGIALIAAGIFLLLAKRRQSSGNGDPGYQNNLLDGRQSKSSQMSYVKGLFSDNHSHTLSAGSSNTPQRMATFTDNRMKTDTVLYQNGRRDSSVSLQDNEDYSRPVLRLTNPD
ncbi:hypothetical protein ARAM_005361 [Aspergillus rambellii]|uniref:WSC domain-containing protein n=2 Tax=Aspergillus subgen. Nidulantes TaxID=2720870 RepID=A0A0F8U772_9EURO|nr:hypothetical protein ARAM_005361 [Aspergillus rambellii]KKK20897.1 hypothetical protein AOCH_004079 [Aspergillus ochraceoroseus]